MTDEVRAIDAIINIDDDLRWIRRVMQEYQTAANFISKQIGEQIKAEKLKQL